MIVFRYIYSGVFIFAIFWAIFIEDLPGYGRIVFPIFALVPLVLNEVHILKTKKLRAELAAHEAKSLENDVYHDFRESN